MTKSQLKDLVKRATWTAIQAGLGTFLTLAPGILAAPNLKTAKALSVAAIVAVLGAALSAIKTFALNWVSNHTAG